MFEFWSKILIIGQLIFLIFYEGNYSKAYEYQINILSWKTEMNTRSWQGNEMKVGTFLWECLPEPASQDSPFSDSLIASQDTAINPAQRTSKMAKRATNMAS